MIQLQNVTKSYPTRLGRKYVLRDVTLTLPGDRNIAILGRNGAGKSTLLRLLGGIDFPDKGSITSNKHISWPLALASGFQGSMTGRENTRFIARIHGGARQSREIERFVQDFSELGKSYDLPVGSYSSGMKSRLAFALSMAFEFDVYLLDEVTSVGDPQFRKKAQQALDERRKHARVIMVAHSPTTLRQFCDFGIVLHNNHLQVYNDLEEAIKVYQAL